MLYKTIILTNIFDKIINKISLELTLIDALLKNHFNKHY